MAEDRLGWVVVVCNSLMMVADGIAFWRMGCLVVWMGCGLELA